MTRSSLRLSIIIVSYNTRDMTLACIRSVYDQALCGEFEIILIDNASTDGSADIVEQNFPEVELIKSQENLGFARANNIAAKKAKGDYILLLNPDTLILNNAVDRLVQFAVEHPDAGIWGGRTVFEDGSLNPASCWRFVSLWSIFTRAVGLTLLLRHSNMFNPEGYGGWGRDTVRQVEFITGCFFLITPSLWRELDGFDETFFMYAEEADLCYRARQLGARPLFTPDATIVHHGGASEVVLSAKVNKLFSGKITFISNHWPEPKRTLGVSLFKLLALLRAAGYSAVALVTRSEKHRSTACEWRRIWLARNRWANGYNRFSK